MNNNFHQKLLSSNKAFSLSALSVVLISALFSTASVASVQSQSLTNSDFDVVATEVTSDTLIAARFFGHPTAPRSHRQCGDSHRPGHGHDHDTFPGHKGKNPYIRLPPQEAIERSKQQMREQATEKANLAKSEVKKKVS